MDSTSLTKPVDLQGLSLALAKTKADYEGKIDAAASSINVGVTSFNGNTGAITYTAPVTSVNSKTGAVVIDKIKTGSAQNSTEYQIITTPENDNHSSPVFVYNEVMATIAKYTGNYARLTLGTGTTPGAVRLYSNDKVSYYTDIKASTESSNKTIVFPNADGTVALTSDILSNLSDLADVSINRDVSNGETLIYDLNSKKWINGSPFISIPLYYYNDASIFVSDYSASMIQQSSFEKSVSAQIPDNGLNIAEGFMSLVFVSDTEAKFSNGSDIITITNVQNPSTAPAEIAGTYQCTVTSIVTETRVNELIAAALAQYGDGDTATYGYNDASEVNY